MLQPAVARSSARHAADADNREESESENEEVVTTAEKLKAGGRKYWLAILGEINFHMGNSEACQYQLEWCHPMLEEK